MSTGAITSISSPYSTKPDTARASPLLVRFDLTAPLSQGKSAQYNHQKLPSDITSSEEKKSGEGDHCLVTNFIKMII